MTGILLIIVGVLYIGVGMGYAAQGNWGMAFAFTCYALANYGIYLGAR